MNFEISPETEAYSMKILVVEDDQKIADYLSSGLAESGYSVELTLDGEEGLKAAKTNNPDLILTDVMLPKLSGLDLVQDLRKNNISTPVIVISAKDKTDDKIDGLSSGADDYLVKPFSLTELLLRINIHLKRGSKQAQNSILKFDDIKMDNNKKEVYRGENKIDLHVKEYQLLEYLLSNPEKVMTKSQILEKLWGYTFDPQTNVVDVLVCRLRNKIDKDYSSKIIHTIRGMGYVLKKDK